MYPHLRRWPANCCSMIPQSAAQTTHDLSQAMYLLAGRVTGDGLAYTWYNRAELIAGRRTPQRYGNGCSATSPYPIRTNWVPLDKGSGTASPDEAPAAKLNELAVKLSRLNGWLQLQSSVTGDSDYPYHLALQRIFDNVMAEDKGTSHEGDHYQMMLQAQGNTRTLPRWVYILSIDCQGGGQVMFPRGGGDNRYPQESGRLDQIPLPGAKFHIGSPFGTDTYVLLTTATALPDQDVLNFEGVVQRGGSGPVSPLARLLGSTSAGTRGSTGELPMDWGYRISAVAQCSKDGIGGYTGGETMKSSPYSAATLVPSTSSCCNLRSLRNNLEGRP